MTDNTETEAAYRYKYGVVETATEILAIARQAGSDSWSEEEYQARLKWLRWRVEEGWTSSVWPRHAGEQLQVDESVRAYARAVLVVEAVVRFHAEHAAQEPMRVKVWQPNEKALAAGLEVGTTVRLPDGRLDVVMAYDHEGDPVVQGPAPTNHDYSGRFRVWSVDDLERVLPPPRKD